MHDVLIQSEFRFLVSVLPELFESVHGRLRGDGGGSGELPSSSGDGPVAGLGLADPDSGVGPLDG